MWPDFSIHGFDNGAGVRSIMRPEFWFSRNIRFRSVSSLLCKDQLSNLVFRDIVFELGPFPETELWQKKTRQKCFSDETPCVVLLCFVFDFSSPFPNSSVKIGFFVGEASQNALFRSKLGLLRKGLLITFPPAKKNGTFSEAALPDYGFRVFRFRRGTDETTVNVVYSVSAPKTNFCRRLFENWLFPMFQPRGAR